MKYMKLFEDNKTEDKEIIEAFEMCFQEFKDKGFKINIYESKCRRIDFNKGPILPTYCDKSNNLIPCFTIEISKYNCNEYFNIKNIINYLLFTENYMKDEFKLNICQIYTMGNYYKGTEYLPLNHDTFDIAIRFTKD